MKHILFYLLLVLSFNGFTMDIINEYATIVKTEKDTTLKKGQSKLIISIFDLQTGEPIKNVEVNLDTNTFIGKTNANGIIKAQVQSGDQRRFCADTPLKNSLVTYFTFSSQFIYTIQVRMNSKKTVPIPNEIRYETVEKPVIYLYPTKKQKINVQVKPKDEFLFTYPKYEKNGWDIVSNPNGKIEYQNKTFNYLFWEGIGSKLYQFDTTTGFNVKSDTLISFLENTLTSVGLTTEEQADFITYWAPRLQQNEFNFIHFDFNDDYTTKVAELIVTPKPDHIIRIFMTYHKVTEFNNSLQPQIIPTYERGGFTVIEWGGSHYPTNKIKI